jgi:hypothetical protein
MVEQKEASSPGPPSNLSENTGRKKEKEDHSDDEIATDSRTGKATAGSIVGLRRGDGRSLGRRGGRAVWSGGRSCSAGRNARGGIPARTHLRRSGVIRRGLIRRERGVLVRRRVWLRLRWRCVGRSGGSLVGGDCLGGGIVRRWGGGVPCAAHVCLGCGKGEGEKDDREKGDGLHGDEGEREIDVMKEI